MYVAKHWRNQKLRYRLIRKMESNRQAASQSAPRRFGRPVTESPAGCHADKGPLVTAGEAQSPTLANRDYDRGGRARGTIYSYTLVQEPAAEFEAQAPLYLALVELQDGELITAQLTDVDGAVAIGDAVEMVTRKLTTDGQRGMIVYGYKFRPAMT